MKKLYNPIEEIQKDSNNIISLLVQSEADKNISGKEIVPFCKLLLVAEMKQQPIYLETLYIAS